MPAKKEAFTRTDHGTWTTRVWIHGQKPRFTADTKPELRAKVKKAIEEANEGLVLDPKAGKMPFGEWWDKWLDGRHDLTDKSKDNYRSAYKCHFAPLFAKRSIETINQDAVKKLVTAMIDKGLAPRTVHCKLAIFGACLQAAIDQRRIKGPNPACPKTLELPAVREKRPLIIKPPQIEALAGVINPHYRVLVMTAGYSGLRIGELLALEVGDVDLSAGRIHVNKTLVESAKKGLHVQEWGKSKKALREVPIPGFLVKILREHMAGRRCDDLVFPAMKGKHQRLGSNWRPRYWRPAIELTDISRKFRFHDLRHTAISLWIASGATPLQCKTWAGHSSIKITMDTYGHLFDDGEAGPMAALEALRGLAAPALAAVA